MSNTQYPRLNDVYAQNEDVQAISQFVNYAVIGIDGQWLYK